MKKWLLHYLENKDLLNPSQFNLRGGRNTFQALSIFSSNTYSALDNSQAVLSIFVDFAKAFIAVLKFF